MDSSAAVFTMRVQRRTKEQVESKEFRDKIEGDVDKIKAAADRIKRYTRIYQERLEGTRR